MSSSATSRRFSQFTTRVISRISAPCDALILIASEWRDADI
jgi:hypothetical protein